MRRALLAVCAAALLSVPMPVLADEATAVSSDAVRLSAAQKAVAALVPEGVYVRMMRDQFPALMDGMMAQMMGMPASDIGEAKADGKTVAEVAKSKDPHFEERMKIMTQVMAEEMGQIMGKMEPRVRAGLARAFARKFSEQQLDDMNAFFATSSGKAFAQEYLLLFADPEMMKEMMAAVPEMLNAMPAIMAKVQQATAHLPSPPKTDSAPDKEQPHDH